MRTIRKVAAIVIRDGKFLMVRKKGKEIWTSLGGRPEPGETDEQALLREIQEEIHCPARIESKIGDFKAKAAFDDGFVTLSTYLVELHGPIFLDDPELAEFTFVGPSWKSDGLKLPDSIVDGVIPACIRAGLLPW